MAVAREWLERDFYADLGVAKDASPDEIKKSYRKLARELHPDANANNAQAEERFKAVSEAHSVLSDSAKRKEYDEARRAFGAGRFQGGTTFRPGPGGADAGFDLGDLFGGGGAAGGGGLGDILGGMFGRSGRAEPTSRPRRGKDLEAHTGLSFRDAARGTTKPLTLTSPAPCTTCHGSGARPGTSPTTCTTCHGSGIVSRNQGAFGFSEPCTDCHGTGQRIDDPCVDCGGTGVTTRTRTISVRIPPGVEDGQRIRLAGQGEAGMRGAPSGDLYVTVAVASDPVFTRSGNDLKVTVPVDFAELVLGTTVSVPTLDGRVGVKVPAGTADGRTLRVRGRGIPKRAGGAGDLLVTVKVAVPENLDAAAIAALKEYQEAAGRGGFDPRAGWAGA